MITPSDLLPRIEADILNPVLLSPRASAALKKDARFTRMSMRCHPEESRLRYFWNAVEGAQHERLFVAMLRSEGFMSFEDLAPVVPRG